MVAQKFEHIDWKKQLAGLIRPLSAKLNIEAIAFVAAELSEALKLPSDMLKRQPDETAKILERVLLRLLVQWRGDDEKLENSVKEWRELYYRTPEGSERYQILNRRIEEGAGSRIQRFMDQAALKRTMDWEAMEERLALERWQLWMRQLVILEALEGLYLPEEDRPGVTVILSSQRGNMAPANSLMTYFKGGAYPLLKRACLGTLIAFLKNSSESREIFFSMYEKALLRSLKDKSENRWVKKNILDLLALAPSGRARSLLLSLVGRLDESGDNFLLRAQALRALSRTEGSLSDLKSELPFLVGASGTGEYVRLAAVEAATNIEGEAGLELLVQLAETENARPDAELTVKARLAEALSVSMQRMTYNSASVGQACRYLALWASHDPEAPVRRVAQEESAVLIPLLSGIGAEESCKILVLALQRRLSSTGLSGEAERIAGLMEEIRIVTNPILSELKQSLETIIEGISWGQSKKLKWPLDGLSEHDFMRITASITRAEAGLYVKFNKKSLVMTRGERFKSKFWRTYHEITNLRPNMRPDISHRRGRYYKKPHRAHPQIMAEVNPTLVPGERRFVEAEGGWARYLPQMDDLLETSKPVYLYSSYGLTTIKAPMGFAKIKSKLSLNLRYYSWNSRRYETLSQSEQWRKGEFVRSLREQFGFQIDFKPWNFELFGVPIDLETNNVSSYFNGGAKR